MEEPQLLNENFQVFFNSGGCQQNKEDTYGAKNILSLKPRTPHCTQNGKNFDLVLKYVPKEGQGKKFSLTHFLIHGGFNCSSPIKEGLLWVHDEEPKIEDYAKYNDITLEEFNKLEKKPNELFFVTNNNIDQDMYEFEIEFPQKLVGSYIHFKWLRPTKGTNYDIDMVALVGFPKADANYAKIGKFPPQMKISLSSLNVIDVRLPKIKEEYSFRIPHLRPRFMKVGNEANNLAVCGEEYIVSYTCPDGAVAFMNYQTNEFLGKTEEKTEGTVTAFRIHGNVVWAASFDDQVIRAWSVKSRKQIFTITRELVAIASSHWKAKSILDNLMEKFYVWIQQRISNSLPSTR